jgi:polyisoprenoid-binding protein YceI
MKKYLFVFLPLVFLGAGCSSSPASESFSQSQPVVEQEIVLQDGLYELDLDTGTIGWEASKVKLTHNGTITAKEGSVRIENGIATEGSILVDMSTIHNLDQEGKFLELLEAHLKSEDFFSVETFPISSFSLTEFVRLNGIDGSNYRAHGALTIKDQTHEIEFPAMIEVMDGRVHLGARVTVDRTLYDVRFGSGKFFDPKTLGDNLIDDEFYLDLDLVFVWQ